MREAELLNALAQAPGGVSVDVRRNGVCTVSTYYEPYVVGVGKTLMDAALDCAHWLFDVAYDRPKLRESLPDVFAALEEYDKHSERLL